MRKIYTLIFAIVILSNNSWGQARLWAYYYGTSNYDLGWRMADDGANITLCGAAQPTNFEGFWKKYSYAGVSGTSYTTATGGVETAYTGIDIDALGNIYIVGYTRGGSGLTTAGTHQQVFGGGTYDLVIQKFNSSGTLIWGTYFGGAANEYSGMSGIQVDNSGNVYIASNSNSSSGISTVGSFQPTLDPGGQDAVVAKFNSNGTLAWATYYGGSGFDTFTSIDLDASGNMYVSGYFNSTGLSFNGYQASSSGENSFIAKFDNTGNRIWSTYLGSGGRSYGIKCDNAGSCVYVSGYTASSAFIPYNGFQMTYGGGLYDGYIVKFTTAGTRIWGTYYGGTGRDQSMGITLDASENVFASGLTGSTTGMGVGGYQNTFGGGTYDATIIKLDSAGTRIYSSYYGGTGNDDGMDAHIDSQNNLYLSGSTNSTNAIATSGSFLGVNDAYIVKFSNPCSNPATPGAISGTTTICSGSSNTYSIAAVVGTTSYTWTLPGGWSGTSTTNSINTTSSATSGNITVTANNACGSSTPQTLAITVNTIPSTPGTISGSATICSGSSNTYSVTNDPSATSYTWTLPGGWSGTSTTNSINTTSSATSGNITVTANNSCGSSLPQTLAITVSTAPSTPVTISGTATICSGSSNTYSVANDPSATSYTWSLPGGWSGTSTTNSINTTASATSGNITVIANNACGSSTPEMLAITVNTIPSTPGTISGNTTVCSGSNNTYSVINDPSATSYTWTFPGGWSGTSTTNSINTTASATSGNITVTANNACGNSSPQTLAIIVNTAPATPGTISGLTTICSGSSNTYSVTNDLAANSYTWTLPGGWSGTSTTNSINTTASSTSGNITVSANNTCGNSSPQTLTITVNTAPATPGTISGSTSICDGSSNTYSVTNDPTATSYTWTLPGGWSGTSTTNSINTTASSTSGNVMVTANNSCGNSSQQTLAVTVNPLPSVNFNYTGQDTVCINYAVQVLIGGTPLGGTYSGTGVTGTNFDPNTAGLGTHNITYSFTDLNTCTNTDVISITVIGCAGIGDNNQSSIIVYPNPFTNSITLTGIENGTEVKLHNALGEVLANWVITENNNTFSTENFCSGIYFISIYTRNGMTTREIIKQ